MRGRKRKPTHLKLIMGNPSRRPLRPDSIEVEPVLPDPPDHLFEDGKAEWRRVAQGLYALRLLSTLDINALAAYCQSFAIWKQASEAITAGGLTIETTNGNVIQNPLVGIANKAASDMVRYAAEFGMTPSARARINAGGEGQAPKDPTEKYFA
jgi:P27 family predicted phage terminase small subunit